MTIRMLNLRAFCLSACLILGTEGTVAMAQSTLRDVDDWAALKDGHNIFALRDKLEGSLPVSDGVRALSIAYIGAFSQDFDIANQNLNYARNYASARRDHAFAREVQKIEHILLREQGRYDALSAALQAGAQKGGMWQRMVSFWADTKTSARAQQQNFTIENISPDDARIVLPATLAGKAGTVLFDSGAEGSLLSATYAKKYNTEKTDINFSMLTVDGPRNTELASLQRLSLGAMEFENIPVGIQKQTDGVIGFFLNKGATGILGWPLIGQFGSVDFRVHGSRVEALSFKASTGRQGTIDKPNIMIRADKPYIKVDVEGATYACIFDTGSPRSIFSSAIVARHERALGLSYLSGREEKQLGLYRKNAGAERYLASFPVRAGHREVSLEFPQILAEGGGPSEFCLIGLDAVINSGGARLDIDDLQLRFGPASSLTSRAYNLR